LSSAAVASFASLHIGSLHESVFCCASKNSSRCLCNEECLVLKKMMEVEDNTAGSTGNTDSLVVVVELTSLTRCVYDAIIIDHFGVLVFLLLSLSFVTDVPSIR
jgi:hypothetical protein